MFKNLNVLELELVLQCFTTELVPFGPGQNSNVMDFSLSYAGFDLSDPEKEKMGILSLQLKEKNVLHSVSIFLQKNFSDIALMLHI